ncbi:MAG: hypothetical protein KF746_01300 [Chitinophagaceae bacterium]|nr:hypothetical protein [Chitinophagaceae bacterium]
MQKKKSQQPAKATTRTAKKPASRKQQPALASNGKVSEAGSGSRRKGKLA